MTKPFIIMSAPNGARRQKSDHPSLPLTPHDLAECAAEIMAAGASILHLHVRDDQGVHSLDVDRYRTAITAIRDAVGDDLIIQATSEAVGQYSRLEQIDMVKRLKPEAVSLALRELVPSEDELSEFADFIDWMRRENIFPQYILYDEADYRRFDSYLRRGIFQNDHPFTLCVLGRYQATSSAQDAKTEALKLCTTEAKFPWAVCGFGLHEIEAIHHAAHHGGHIRVGFENNIWKDKNHLLSNHSEMITQCKKAALKENRTIATAQNIRKTLNHKKG